MPEWIEKFKAEGLDDAQIDEIIRGKTEKYIGKWGNTSKVGILINAYDGLQNGAKERLVMDPKT